MKQSNEKHLTSFPSARKIRRACNLELYRTAKRLKIWIPPDKMEAAEKLYVRKVAENMIWIHEHHSNRTKLSDWWEANVNAEIAELWQVDAKRLADAFRDAFGG
ncbi:hypothetical protein BG53_10225 [Paenibacillus darwinianus]|uniref:Dehydrogenase n=1 Tax=Paenibacillus darwinianus TaxID=1380763 RepID=A0A9W5W611_9BACL|nr:hypothetical protein [Paenibacillus darwinianus]EXX84874.1 hypothetical protein BG53_10225 [Paenibacillus darwinianus]EXX84971.1 hypothetical protein CH50_10400 [Paenibacillus darwinianus]EXX84998.1 hypothetical protein BG52_09360 [Paenibacillus darwinianus]